ncbi:MAG: AbiH family protein, partial [Metamycoplasmataceae bacterium]
FEDIPLPEINVKLKEFILENQIEIIVSFNYTKTPEIYDFKSFYFNSKTNRNNYNHIESWINKSIMLHAFDSEEIQTIIGHDKNEKLEKDLLINNWYDKSKFNPKSQVLKTISESEKINELIFLGFSFGDSDQKIIEFINDIIKKKKLVTIYYYKKIDESIIRNIKKSKFCKIYESTF